MALYMVSLGLSAGLMGVFAHEVLDELGYVHGLESDVMVAGAVACAYACVQLLYMAVVRLLKPTRSPGPLFAETLSHLAALAFIPYLMDMAVKWPHPVLYKVEPLVYLAGFGAVHAFFKLASFYAAIRGKPCGRFWALGWLVASMLCAATGYWAVIQWLGVSRAVQPQAAGAEHHYRVGGQYAAARAVPEGAVVAYGLSDYPDPCLTLRWANVPDPGAEVEPLERIHVSITIEGEETRKRSFALTLNPDSWRGLQISAASMPPKARRCSILWQKQEPPAWHRLLEPLGLSPIAASNAQVLLSGPFEHEGRGASGEPSFVVIVAEGLGAAHVSGFGYERATTPALDGLAAHAMVYPEAYTPAPEAEAACMSLLTGVTPLTHGYLGSSHGPLGEDRETLAEVLQAERYATAAFTEGEATGEGDLVFGSGFERGFEVFDASYRAAASDPDGPTGSASTLERVSQWIDDHADSKFLVFVRLRELREPRWEERYAPGFAPDEGEPTPRDVYDSAVAYLDGELGALIDHIRSGPAGHHVCLVVTSAYGLDFSAGRDALPVVGLTEDSLRVPLILYGPQLRRTGRQPHRVSLEDVAATLFSLAHTGVGYVIDGRSLVENPQPKDPISMFGSPLALSLRSDQWRYSWQSGWRPFAEEPTDPAGDVELYDVKQAEKQGYKRDAMRARHDLVAQYRARLKTYLKRHRTGVVR